MLKEKRSGKDIGLGRPRTGKKNNENTLVRRMYILSKLPVENRGINGMSAAELHALLPSEYATGIRTVERDLQKMSEKGSDWKELGIELKFSYDAGDRRIKRWYHSPKSKALLFHAMSDEEAALLALLDQELKFLLPPSAAQSFLHYLDRAKEVLSRPGRTGSRAFKDRIRVVPDGPQRIPPEIDMAHVHAICDALFHEEQLDVTYDAAKNESASTYRLHPIGLLRQGMFYYLVAVKDQNVARKPMLVQTFRVDRIRAIKRRLHDPLARGLPSLDEAIEGGVVEVSDGETLKLRLRVRHGEETKWVRHRFVDAPLSADQMIMDRPDGSFDLTATVRDSRKLTNLLQEVAHYVDVLEPVSLQQKIDAFVEAAAAMRRRRQ